MTQPDKWDEIAAKYFYPTRFMAWGPEDRNEFATALRSAYEEGEKAGTLAGLMKAGSIATLEPDFHMKSEYQMGYEAGRNTAATAIYSEAAAIRAAKETKE